MLAVIDYGAGNLRSVMHSLHHIGAKHIRLVQAPDDLDGAEKIILPGVGAFGAGMQQLHAQGLVEPIREAVNSGIPYLGICLGMQFLFEESDEMGQHQGTGLLQGKVTRFRDQPGRKVPHMGWNQLQICKPTTLFDGISDDDYAYFVHSYYCVPEDDTDTAAIVEYGENFTVAVQRDNIYGVQFHPEKSQRTGLQLLTNFLTL
jgi:glutamine amidotransferase